MSVTRRFRIALGSDHAGFTYKEAIETMLLGEGHTVHDFGTHSTEPCDYPDFVLPVALAVELPDEDVIAVTVARIWPRPRRL